MKYIIMLIIVIGLALADFATGWIKPIAKVTFGHRKCARAV